MVLHQKEWDYTDFKQQRFQTATIIRAVKKNFERNQLSQLEEISKITTSRTFDIFLIIASWITNHLNLCFKNKEQQRKLWNTSYILQETTKLWRNKRLISKTKSKLNFKKFVPPNLREIHEIIKDEQNDKVRGEDSIIADMYIL